MEKKFEYDSQNRPIKKLLPDNTYNITYDDQGNVEEIEDLKTRAVFTYNEFKKVTSVTTEGKGDNADFPTVSLNYNYDSEGNKISMESPLGTTTYSYNNLNYLVGLSNHLGESFSFDRDSEGNITKVTRPNSVTTNVFDEINYIKSITHTTATSHLSFYDYERDGVGNRLNKKTFAGNYIYEYDKNDQLSKASNPEQSGDFASESFSYDSLGNQLSNGYIYDNSKLQLIESANYIYTYDVYGNLTSRQSKLSADMELINYFYNSENRLIGIDYYVGSIPVKKVQYSYDVLGRRIEKIVDDLKNSKQTTRRYAYDGNEILIEYDGSNNVLASYTHSRLRTDDVLSVNVTDKGVIEAIAKEAQSYYFLKDAIGTVTDITDKDGNIVQRYNYSAFGILLDVRDYNGNSIANAPVVAPFYTFTGREYDSESGFYYYRARFYDPAIGRFTQFDPHPGDVTNPLTIVNKYIYALNNPVNLVDPSGLFWKKLWKKIKKAVKKITKNKVVGLAISSIAFGGIGALAYINMSGQFHPNDVAFVNNMVIAAAAAYTGGLAGAAAGSFAGGVVAGAAAGAITGGVVGGALSVAQGGSFVDGFTSGAMTGLVSGAIAGGIAGYNSMPTGSKYAQSKSINNSQDGILNIKPHSGGGGGILEEGAEGIFNPGPPGGEIRPWDGIPTSPVLGHPVYPLNMQIECGALYLIYGIVCG